MQYLQTLAQYMYKFWMIKISRKRRLPAVIRKLFTKPFSVLLQNITKHLTIILRVLQCKNEGDDNFYRLIVGSIRKSSLSRVINMEHWFSHRATRREICCRSLRDAKWWLAIDHTLPAWLTSAAPEWPLVVILV